jgi:hypothetical protein
MMQVFKICFLLFLVFFTLQLSAQRRNYGGDSYNRLGAQAGVTHGGIESDNFNTTKTTGFTGGLTTRANVWNNFLVVYGVNFYSMKTGIMGHVVGSSEFKNIEFKTTGVQLNLFAGHKIIKENLSIEVGPILQINSKWEVDNQFKDHLIEDYAFAAKDLEKVSRVNLNMAAAISAGIADVKIWLQYQYGVTNFLEPLNDTDLKSKDPRAANLEGHLGLATAGLVFYF